LPAILAYAGDTISILSLSIMFGLSLAVQRNVPGISRVKVWALPVLAVLVSFPLGYLARTWPPNVVSAGVVLGARALAAGLFALAHLSLAQRRG
jgi:hypothetical protein